MSLAKRRAFRFWSCAPCLVVLVVGASFLASWSLSGLAWVVRQHDVIAYLGTIVLLTPTVSAELLKFRIARQRDKRQRLSAGASADLVQIADDYIAELEAKLPTFDTRAGGLYAVGMVLVSLGFGLKAFE